MKLNCSLMLITSFWTAAVIAQTDQSELLTNLEPKWSVSFRPNKLNMTMDQSMSLELTVQHMQTDKWGNDFELHVLSGNKELLQVQHIIRASDLTMGATSWHGNFSIQAIFVGHTTIHVQLKRAHLQPEMAAEYLDVIITRSKDTSDAIYKIFVACLVLILYVNFGAVLELNDLKRILLRPIGPAIGFFGQFIIMPLLSFLIGHLMFRDNIELRLGLFFTGSTPAGGASNIFTVILNGNLNLSITMTTLSNLAAFAMMPLWIFTLGVVIFRDGNFIIPYRIIVLMSLSLVLPLGLGIALQKYMPELAIRIAKLLKPISFVMIVMIIISGLTVNWYVFKLFTWQILLASSALPWLGYLFGWLMAILCRQSRKDTITIAIETGIQNIAIAIFMLNFTLPQPEADLTTAVPLAIAMMTPLPLLLLFIIQKCFYYTSIEEVEPAPTQTAQTIEVEHIVTGLNNNNDSVK